MSCYKQNIKVSLAVIDVIGGLVIEFELCGAFVQLVALPRSLKPLKKTCCLAPEEMGLRRKDVPGTLNNQF